MAHVAARRQELLDQGASAEEADRASLPRDPISGRGQRIVELRARLGGRFTRLEQLEAEPAGLDEEDIARLRDYLSLDAWLDTAMVGFSPSGKEVPQPRAPVNVNTASASELEALPGVGEVIAQRIIDYRTANGPFSSVDELLEVSGIGDATLASMRELVSV